MSLFIHLHILRYDTPRYGEIILQCIKILVIKIPTQLPNYPNVQML